MVTGEKRRCSYAFPTQLFPLEDVSVDAPALLMEGMVPRDSALLRRLGRDEGDALRSRGLCGRLMSLDRLGGGLGMKESATGNSEGWRLPRGGATEPPERHLQDKSKAVVQILRWWQDDVLSSGKDVEVYVRSLYSVEEQRERKRERWRTYKKQTRLVWIEFCAEWEMNSRGLTGGSRGFGTIVPPAVKEACSSWELNEWTNAAQRCCTLLLRLHTFLLVADKMNWDVPGCVSSILMLHSCCLGGDRKN